MEREEEKRSIRDEEGGNGEEEDEKVEQFFDLIRRFQEVRKEELRRQGWSKEMIDGKIKNKRVRRSDQGEKPSWTPAFEPEDFMEDLQFLRHRSLVFPVPSRRETEETKTEQKRDLDLNLSL